MISPRAIEAMAAALIAAAGLLAMAGCSCKASQPPAPKVVKVQPKPPQPPSPPAAPAQPAQPAPNKPASSEGVVGSVLKAPGEYLYTTTVTAPRYAKKTVAQAYVENEIKDFWALKGRYPASLDELGQWLGEPVQAAPPGTKYSYDPKTGALNVVPAE
jgi:hypothetical protein